jgi:hypothetical protein
MGMLLGIFHVNTLHNLFYIATGIIALCVGKSSQQGSKIFFQVFGVIYILFAVLGFSYENRPLLGLIANNIADAWFHLIVGILSLYFGFGLKKTGKSK